MQNESKPEIGNPELMPGVRPGADAAHASAIDSADMIDAGLARDLAPSAVEREACSTQTTTASLSPQSGAGTEPDGRRDAPPPLSRGPIWATLTRLVRLAMSGEDAYRDWRKAAVTDGYTKAELERLSDRWCELDARMRTLLHDRAARMDLQLLEEPGPGGELARVTVPLSYSVRVYRDGNGDVSEVLLVDPGALLDEAANLGADDLAPFVGGERGAA